MTNNTPINTALFPSIYAEAHAVGMTAGTAHAPVPMVVGTATTAFGSDLDYNKPTYFVPDGVCGFAWVTVSPGTCAFAKWLKKQGYARKGYYGGVEVSVREFGQSMERKECYAYAFANVLTGYGITAYANSRMD